MTTTYGGLTVADLATAAHDLRNAALVIRHAGHYQGALTEHATGAVCLVGAIDLATYRKLVKSPRAGWVAPSRTSEEGPFAPGYHRADAAILVLADFVPTGLCPACDDEHDCPSHICSPRQPWEIVTHYNDQHCISADLAINMLRLAAAEAEAASVRKAEANRRELVTV